jgi:hypothetical protein
LPSLSAYPNNWYGGEFGNEQRPYNSLASYNYRFDQGCFPKIVLAMILMRWHLSNSCTPSSCPFQRLT